MSEEFEYTVLTRYRTNEPDTETNQRPLEPNWGPWSAWGALRPFPTLAGAAMSAAGRNQIHRTYDRDPNKRVPYAQTQAVIGWRKVPKDWTLLFPEPGEEV